MSPADLALLRAHDAAVDGRRAPRDPDWRKRPRVSAKRRRMGKAKAVPADPRQETLWGVA